MASPTDITDPALREQMLDADRALDTGEYLGSIQRCADVFERLLRQRPDVFVPPPDLARLSSAPRPPIGGRRGPWPSQFGVQLSLEGEGAEQQPRFTYAKEHFSMTEAAAYFEYTLDALLYAQRTPAPSTT